jgi:hypothetical protein
MDAGSCSSGYSHSAHFRKCLQQKLDVRHCLHQAAVLYCSVLPFHSLLPKAAGSLTSCHVLETVLWPHLSCGYM